MLDTLIQIYNTLATIDTHGSNTLKMAGCLNALEEVVKQLQPTSETSNAPGVTTDDLTEK